MGQDKRIYRAYKTGRGCRIGIHKCSDDASCCKPALLELSPNQSARLKKSPASATIPFTHAELKRNASVQGGFLPLIIAAIASSIAGPLVEHAIAGAGLIWKRKDDEHLRVRHRGEGLQLSRFSEKIPGEPGFYYHGKNGSRPASGNDFAKISQNGRQILHSLLI